MVCELCGSSDIVKQDGAFVCHGCGCKYSLEEAKKLAGGQGGCPVVSNSAVNNGSKDAVKQELLATFLELGYNALNIGNAKEVYTYAKKAIETDIRNLEGWVLLGLYHARTLSNKIDKIRHRSDARMKNFQAQDERFNRKFFGDTKESMMMLFNGGFEEHFEKKDESLSINIEDEQIISAAYKELAMCCEKLDGYQAKNPENLMEIGTGLYTSTLMLYTLARNTFGRHITDVNAKFFKTVLSWLSNILINDNLNWTIKIVEPFLKNNKDRILTVNQMVRIVTHQLALIPKRNQKQTLNLLDYLSTIPGISNESMFRIRYAKLSFVMAGDAPFEKKFDVHLVGEEVMVTSDQKISSSKIEDFTDDYVYCLFNGHYVYMYYGMDESILKNWVNQNIGNWKMEWQAISNIDPKLAKDIESNAKKRVEGIIEENKKKQTQLYASLTLMDKITKDIDSIRPIAYELYNRYESFRNGGFVDGILNCLDFVRNIRMDNLISDTKKFYMEQLTPLENSFETAKSAGKNLNAIYSNKDPFVDKWKSRINEIEDSFKDLRGKIYYLR